MKVVLNDPKQLRFGFSVKKGPGCVGAVCSPKIRMISQKIVRVTNYLCG